VEGDDGQRSDASDRRRSAPPSQRSDAGFRRLIECAPDAIGVERSGILLYANPTLVDLLGVPSAKDVVGRAVADLVHPEDRPRLLDAVSGRTKPARKGQSHEYRIVRPDGELRTLDVIAIGIEFEGEPAVLGFARDVTERNRLRAEVMEADRLAAMGTLAAGVGHEINNPLAYALLNMQALEREIARVVPLERAADALQMVRNALVGIDRVRAIAHDLKAFSRSDPETRGPIDVRSVLESALNMAAHEIRLRATLVTHFEEVPPVLANEARLGQVLLNLLVNAAQALPERPRGRHEVRVSVLLGEGDQVVVEVADTGPGIPDALLERIFEPYFTTKPLGKGTGLGLSIARSIVKSLGGTLAAANCPQGGAVFRLSLPALGAYASKPGIPVGARRGQGRIRVLIVEDEPALALALERAIEESHDALVAPDGREALGVLLRDPTFDAVLCDLMLSGMSGIELFEEVRGKLPELAGRFVFMTGASQTARMREFLASVGRPWLEKPFDAAALRQLLTSLAPAAE
jgi:PAS domain S-box-containing protein